MTCKLTKLFPGLWEVCFCFPRSICVNSQIPETILSISELLEISESNRQLYEKVFQMSTQFEMYLLECSQFSVFSVSEKCQQVAIPWCILQNSPVQLKELWAVVSISFQWFIKKIRIWLTNMLPSYTGLNDHNWIIWIGNSVAVYL